METSLSPLPNRSLDILDKIRWAKDHPDEVRAIVDNARSFAELHLSELAQTCYVARLLSEYQQLLIRDAKISMTSV